MPGMASESLRPLTRETIRRLTFLATLLDMLPPLLVSLGWMILVCASSRPDMIPGMLSIWIVCVIALYAFMMWMQLVNRLWVIAVALLACYLTASGVGIGLVVLRHSTNDFDLNPADLITIAAGLFVLTGLGLAYAWRRWGTVEFGMLDR